MRFIPRGVWALVVLLLLAHPLFAQESDNTSSGEINVVGSGIVLPLFSALADEAGLSTSATATGNETGFEQFCAGQAAAVTSTRPINPTEESNCNATGTSFYELIVGYDVLVYVANAELTFLQCLSIQQVNGILAPTAVQSTTWDAINAQAPESLTVNVYLPDPGTTTYALLENEVSGFGFRADAQILTDSAAVLDAVADEPGGFGVVQLSAVPQDTDVNVLEVRNDQIGTCVLPSAESIADGSYTAGVPLYTYINGNSAELAPLLQLASNPESTAVVNAAGFTAPTDADYEIMAEFVGDSETGRQFSRTVTEFQIPPNVTGTVTIGGAPGAFSLLNEAGTAMNQQFQNVTVTVNTDGEPVGLRRLCNGEIDFAVTYTPLDQETLNNCEAIDIDVQEIEIGRQAAVLVANAADDYLTCLTTEQITAVWGADEAELPTNWQQIDDSFPDQEFILFAGGALGADIPNIMLQQAAGGSVPLREDTETNADPLFRAAAVANVLGSLTYMSWGDYQDVLANDQQRIQLVAVGGADGCVTPSEDTIADGSYALTRSIRLAISMRALERVEVQSYLWFIFQDRRFAQLEQLEFAALSLRDLSNIRETLQTAYEAANTAAAERAAAAAATEEAVPAATVDVASPEAPVETEAIEDAAEDDAPVETEAVEDAAEDDAPAETEAVEAAAEDDAPVETEAVEDAAEDDAPAATEAVMDAEQSEVETEAPAAAVETEDVSAVTDDAQDAATEEPENAAATEEAAS